MNDTIRAISFWFWDYSMLAAGLLIVVCILNQLIKQPARRMAVHWSAAVGLTLLAVLCLMPEWSTVNLTSRPELPPAYENYEFFGPMYEVIVTPPTPSEFESFEMSKAEGFAEPHLMDDGSSVMLTDGSLLLPYLIVSGSVFVVLWLFIGRWQVRRLLSQSEPAPVELADLLKQLAPVGQSVPRLAIAKKLPVAVAVGLRQPTILLPQSFLDLPSPSPSLKGRGNSIEAVLAHELAHVRHRDLWLLALLRGLLLVLWPNPLFWLWRRSVRLDQETLADASAAEVTNRVDYAEQLVVWARETASGGRRLPLASSVGLWESRSQLKRRIAILLDEKLTVLRECSRRWRVGCVLLLVALAIGLSLVTLQPAAIAVDDQDSLGANVTEKLAARSNEDEKHAAVEWPGSLMGSVVDDEGQPVAGAGLTLTLQEIYQFGIGRWDKTVATVDTISDRDGYYEFDLSDFPKKFRHRPFSLMLTGAAEGYSDARTWHWHSGRKEGSVPAGLFNTLKMPRGRTVTGRCIDPNGEPVSGAVIRTNVDYGAKWMHEAIQADAQGNFEIPLSKQGAGQIWIYSRQWAPKHVPIAKDVSELGDISLERGTMLEGTVRNRDGSPQPGCVVLVDSKYSGNMDRYSFDANMATKTDEQGRYQFQSLKGEYKVYLAQAGKREDLVGEQFVVSSEPPPATFSKDLSFDGVQAKVVADFSGRDTVTVSGNVLREDGSPVEGCDVRFTSGSGAWLGHTRSDVEGKYVFEIPKSMPDVLLFVSGAFDESGKWKYAYSTGSFPEAKLGRMQDVRLDEPINEDRTGYDWVIRDRDEPIEQPKVNGTFKATDANAGESSSYQAVRIVVGTDDKMTFEGKETTWEELPKQLGGVTRRGETVLEYAIATDELGFGKVNQLKTRMAFLAERYNFKYSSFVGVHPLNSRAAVSKKSATRRSGVTGAVSHFDGKVELLAIGTDDNTTQRWWDRKGKPLASVPFTWEMRNTNDVGGSGASAAPDTIHRRFVIKINDLPKDARISWWRQQGIRGTTGGIISVDGELNPHGYKAQVISLGNDLKSIDLRIRIAAGPWKTMHKLTSSGYNGSNGKSITLFDPRDNAKHVQVAISHNYSDQDYRLFAVDKQGKEHIQAGWGGRNANGIITAHASFPGLSPEEVSYYLFKVRNYEWVVLKDLPLQPVTALERSDR